MHLVKDGFQHRETSNTGIEHTDRKPTNFLLIISGVRSSLTTVFGPDVDSIKCPVAGELDCCPNAGGDDDQSPEACMAVVSRIHLHRWTIPGKFIMIGDSV